MWAYGDFRAEKSVKVEREIPVQKGRNMQKKRMTAPVRMLTSSVRVNGGVMPVVSVKTASAIPKEKIKECAEALKSIEVKAPIAIGEAVVKDLCHTGVDLVATRNVQAG